VDITAFVGPSIRILRERAGISQEELAGRAGLDRTYVSGIERGRRNPSVKSLQRVADALDVGLDLLFVEARQLAEMAARKEVLRPVSAGRAKRGE
jgi:transcriptional regulator with XRE-family HTH domain